MISLKHAGGNLIWVHECCETFKWRDSKLHIELVLVEWLSPFQDTFPHACMMRKGDNNKYIVYISVVAVRSAQRGEWCEWSIDGVGKEGCEENDLRRVLRVYVVCMCYINDKERKNATSRQQLSPSISSWNCIITNKPFILNFYD